jgi:hypothetical protein
LLAVEFGRRTQPFGNKQEAGESRVKNDIGKIIKTNASDDGPNEMILKVENARIRERLEQLAAGGRWDVVKIIFKNIGFLNVWSDLEPIGAGAYNRIHQDHRNPRTGRTRKRGDKLYVTDQNTLNGYITEIQKRVGLSKGGWAEAARQINTRYGARGLPPWVTRHDGGGVAVDHTNDLREPTVTLTNSIPWVDRILPLTERIKAQQVVVAKMKKQIAKILEKAAKVATA